MTNKTDYTEPAVDSTARKCIDALMKSQAESDKSFSNLSAHVRALDQDLNDLRTELRSLDSRPRTFAMSPKEFEAYELGVARGKELALERPGREAR